MGTTVEKLQKALENKQLIVDSVNAKAGTSYDINSKPSDIALAINNILDGASVIKKDSGTTVPIGENVETIYFNTNIKTVDEMLALLESNGVQLSDFVPILEVYGYFVFFNSETYGVVILYDVDSNLEFENFGIQITDFSTSEFITICEWNKYDFSDNSLKWYYNSFEVNSTSTSTVDPNDDGNIVNVGSINDKLSNIISITPFEQESKNIELSGEYDGTSIEVTNNQVVDIETLLSENKLPLKINVNVASSGSGTDMLQERVDATNSCDYLFYEYKGDNVDFIANLDTSKVTNMFNMFYNCSNITTIPPLDTSNVTNMKNIFRGCSKLVNSPQLNTSKATNMQSMFQACISLTSIPQLDTSKATSLYAVFESCKELNTLPRLNTSQSTNFATTFKLCNKLKYIDISYYNISSTSNVNNMCQYCYSLTTFIIRSFGNNYSLNSNSFGYCCHLLGTVNTTYNPNGLKDGYIYVPRAMVDTLKSATNWSAYADQIRALEDYTLDGTTNGELNLTAMGLEE